MAPDEELLRRFAHDRDESAFTELVRRRIDFVYAVALRQVGGDAHLAQDAAQEVFLDLARKARSVAAAPALVSWLYTATRFAAAKVRRRQTRWLSREQEALTMNTILSDGTDPEWETLRPVLDEAMHELGDQDRTALLLRYFENRPLAEVGATLGLAENSARMRVDRAIAKLRTRLAKRGISSTAAALGSTLAAQPAITSPIGLAASAATGALAAAAAAPVVATGTFLFAMNKIAVAAIGIAAALTATVVILNRQNETVPNLVVVSPTSGIVPPTPSATKAIAAAATSPDNQTASTASGPGAATDASLNLDALLQAQKKRAAEVAVIIAEQSAREKVNLSPTAEPAPTVNLAAIAAIEDLASAVAYFRTIASESFPAYLQYVFTIKPNERRAMLMPALFQAWTERDAVGAIAAATQAGQTVELWALSGWARTDLRAAWNWVDASTAKGRFFGNYRANVIVSGVAVGKETTIAAWLQEKAGASFPIDGNTSVDILVREWATKDFPAAAAWMKEMEASHPGSTRTATYSLGTGAANLAPSEFSQLLAVQDDEAWKNIVSGAVIAWAQNNQLDRLRQFLAGAGLLSDERHDAALSSMSIALMTTETDLSFLVIQQIRNPKQRDNLLNTLAGFNMSKPELSMQIAYAIRDQTSQASRMISIYIGWQKKDPAAAQAYISQANFPAELRTKLLELESLRQGWGSEQGVGPAPA